MKPSFAGRLTTTHIRADHALKMSSFVVKAASLKKGETTLKIVFTGDSITDSDHMFEPEGLGNGYVRMIQERLPEHNVINRGYDGYIASRIFRVWDEICISYQPDIVTLLVGVNDLSAYLCGGGGYDANGFGHYIEQIVMQTKDKTSADMILMEPFLFPCPAEYINWMSPLKKFRLKMREMAEKYNIGFVALWDIFQEAQKTYSVDELTIDGIHLTAVGHRILSEAWLNEFQKRSGEKVSRHN